MALMSATHTHGTLWQGLHFKLIQPSDLLLVNYTGEILEESGQKDGPFRILNNAAFMIHSAIHAARPDVMCAAHSHSVYGKTFSALGRMLDPISQDACMFYNVGLQSVTCAAI